MPSAMNEPPTDGEEEPGYIVRLRGLPWSATEEDLKGFFGNSPEVIEISFTYNREGRMSGEAYVQLSSKLGYDAALAKDHEKIGHRYIEVFASKKSEMDYVLKARGKADVDNTSDDSGEPVVRLRGLPFGVTKQEIIEFFDDIQIPEDKICLPNDHSGRPTGEAFVSLQSKDEVTLAVAKHMKNIKHRYIEVFRSSTDEVARVSRRVQGGPGPLYGGGGSGSRPGPYDRGGPGQGGWDRPRQWGPRGGSHGGGWEGRRGRGGGYGSYGNDGGWGSYDSGYGDWGGGGGWGGGKMSGRGDGDRGWFDRGANQGTPGDGANRHFVKIRGVPFSCSEAQIIDFFSPLPVLNVELLKDMRSDRPSGEARAEFYTHDDAKSAMAKDREYMGTRYVELFLMSNAGGGENKQRYSNGGFGGPDRGGYGGGYGNDSYGGQYAQYNQGQFQPSGYMDFASN